MAEKQYSDAMAASLSRGFLVRPIETGLGEGRSRGWSAPTFAVISVAPLVPARLGSVAASFCGRPLGWAGAKIASCYRRGSAFVWGESVRC